MAVINEPYFLAVCVPVKIDQNGNRWCSELWAKDLALHLDYLTNLTLACPCVFAEPTPTDRPISAAPFDRLTFVDLPSSKSMIGALANLPKQISTMWRGMKPARIVHAGFGGWPVSEGWLAIPLATLQRKFTISYVESSFWRVSGSGASWRQILRSFIAERLSTLCIRIANLRFFTSKAYEEDFLGRGDHTAEHSYVTPATWVDDAVILTDDEAQADWNKKSGVIKLLFAGRLIPEKGVRVLLEAVNEFGPEIAISISVIGEGPLAEECIEFARRAQGSASRLQLLKPVKYGPDFFNLLREMDAVIVPSLSDEQPRLIFDAFSQAIPVIGSNTGGIMEVVDDGINGKICTPPLSSTLADTLRWATQNRNVLRSMGLSALQKCRRYTHVSMHRRRSEIIAEELHALKAH